MRCCTPAGRRGGREACECVGARLWCWEGRISWSPTGPNPIPAPARPQPCAQPRLQLRHSFLPPPLPPACLTSGGEAAAARIHRNARQDVAGSARPRRPAAAPLGRRGQFSHQLQAAVLCGGGQDPAEGRQRPAILQPAHRAGGGSGGSRAAAALCAAARRQQCRGSAQPAIWRARLQAPRAGCGAMGAGRRACLRPGGGSPFH